MQPPQPQLEEVLDQILTELRNYHSTDIESQMLKLDALRAVAVLTVKGYAAAAHGCHPADYKRIRKGGLTVRVL